MLGTLPFAHWAAKSERSSCSARAWSYHERPMAMNAESQFHWCGYSVRDGSVEAPSQLASSTARASVSSRARRLSVAGLAFDVTERPPTSTVRGRRSS